MKVYSTLVEAINDLTTRGYTFNFNIKNNYLECPTNSLKLNPNEFEIDEVHRFQDMSDVDNESILFAISSLQYNVKGLLVNAYSIYADATLAALVAQLKNL
ncbi:phosphoribosylpyrophosphate synthetase [Xanthomarina sp.]|uniref:phosphoribosylpyrophosphate synthetase n=1 Tax=Xanthomarina sp. TaxID=1931211 RepID=UPI000C55AFD9|nr:phosphoribosylpyrophosphate synthetase [Xanthomarina sp.]MAL23012.1 phosphoribosylpyrophosphate synthetase [Xanthomarina sp.]HAB26890.1 phosphoribosylpyrophosphate synthetase [Xanthomarina gelatinilytica]|tara:strand:+ start:755 stop:1057 length:303 start_codon:yes stop_codon:yes gene_type:complete